MISRASAKLAVAVNACETFKLFVLWFAGEFVSVFHLRQFYRNRQAAL